MNFDGRLNDIPLFGLSERIFYFPFCEFLKYKFHSCKLGMLFIEQHKFEISIHHFGTRAMQAAGISARINFSVDVGEAQSG